MKSSAPLGRTARALVTAIVTIAGCGGGSDGPPTGTPPPTPVLTTLAVSLSSTTIQVGQTATASVAGFDQKGASIALGQVTWSSGTPGVAAVTSAGMVSAVQPGTALIVATVGNKQGSALLIVAPIPVATVAVSLGYASVMPGQSTEGQVVLRDASGNALQGRAVAWSSSDTTIATVAPNGFVIALAPGNVTVSATSEGRSGSSNLSVQPFPAAVTPPVVEYSPPVYAVAGGKGMTVILDAAASATSATYTPQFAAAIPFRRLGNTSRFVAVLPDTQLARTCSVVCAFGSVSIVDGGGSTTIANTYAPLLAPGTPAVAVAALASDVQRSAYVVNIRDDGVRLSNNTPRLAQRFYQYFGDTFEYIALSEIATTVGSIYFVGARNRVAGTGQQIYDNSAVYGASPSGKLLGFLNFRNFFDLAQQVTSHEMGHAVCCFLKGVALSTGTPHWPLATTAFAIMGSNGNPGSNAGYIKLTSLGGGAFRVDPQSPYGGFNNLELYLLGLADTSEVEPQLVFQDQTQPAQSGRTLQGPATTVTIRDIVVANGLRPTTYTGTPVTFHLATIVVSRGRLLTPTEMSYFDLAAQRGEATTSFDGQFTTPFFVNTRGRGILVTRIP